MNRHIRKLLAKEGPVKRRQVDRGPSGREPPSLTGLAWGSVPSVALLSSFFSIFRRLSVWIIHRPARSIRSRICRSARRPSSLQYVPGLAGGWSYRNCRHSVCTALTSSSIAVGERKSSQSHGPPVPWRNDRIIETTSCIAWVMAKEGERFQSPNTFHGGASSSLPGCLASACYYPVICVISSPATSVRRMLRPLKA